MGTTTTMDTESVRRLSDEATQCLLNKAGTSSSTQGGWMMIATILIEAWDLYAIACTAATVLQCRSKKVSGQSLQKTGILPGSAGDFREFLAIVAPFWRLEIPRIT